MAFDIRKLTAGDADLYYPVRMRALRENPSAFSSTAESWEAYTQDQIAQRLAEPESTAAIYGAFVAGELVGIAGFYRVNANPKLRHRANVVGMYVTPDARNQGIGRRLLAAVIDHAGAQEGVEELELGVTVGNEAARHIYLDAGFAPAYVLPRWLKLDGVYYDMEIMELPLTAQNEGAM